MNESYKKQKAHAHRVCLMKPLKYKVKKGGKEWYSEMLKHKEAIKHTYHHQQEQGKVWEGDCDSLQHHNVC